MARGDGSLFKSYYGNLSKWPKKKKTMARKLEEKLEEKYDAHNNWVGKKCYFSMNDSHTYSGIVVAHTPNSFILKDVDILGTGIKLKDIELFTMSLSARWTEDSYGRK